MSLHRGSKPLALPLYSGTKGRVGLVVGVDKPTGECRGPLVNFHRLLQHACSIESSIGCYCIPRERLDGASYGEWVGDSIAS